MANNKSVWRQLMSNFAFTENRPQWLITDLPTPPANPEPPPFSAYASVGGLLPNVAQAANANLTFNTSPYQPAFTSANVADADQYAQRVVLSPIGGSYNG